MPCDRVREPGAERESGPAAWEQSGSQGQQCAKAGALCALNKGKPVFIQLLYAV